MGSSETVPLKSRGVERQSDGTVRVWSEVGMTLPVSDTTAHIRFLFGHERIAKNGTLSELSRVVADMDKFNEEEVERRVRKYTRLVQSWEADEADQVGEDTRSRAQRRARERREGKR